MSNPACPPSLFPHVYNQVHQKTDRMRVTVQLQVSQRLTCSTRLCQRRIDEHLREMLNEPLAEWTCKVLRLILCCTVLHSCAHHKPFGRRVSSRKVVRTSALTFPKCQTLNTCQSLNKHMSTLCKPFHLLTQFTPLKLFSTRKTL